MAVPFLAGVALGAGWLAWWAHSEAVRAGRTSLWRTTYETARAKAHAVSMQTILGEAEVRKAGVPSLEAEKALAFKRGYAEGLYAATALASETMRAECAADRLS